MNSTLTRSAETISLEEVYERFLKTISQSHTSRNRFSKIPKFSSESEAFFTLLETLESFCEENISSRSYSPSLASSPSPVKSESESIEEQLKKGYLEEGYKTWKTKNFEYIKSLSAGSNFYYLRQILLYIEKQCDKESLDEKEEEIKNLVESYETLQLAYEELKLQLGSFDVYEENELKAMNEDLLEQIEQLEESKAEMENVLRCKVREFSTEIENFVLISEEKSNKITELSELLSQIEEKYQIELEKLRLEHTVMVKKLENSIEKLESEKKDLEADCKGYAQHKKIYDQSLEEFKNHIQALEAKNSELSSENTRIKIQVNETRLSEENLSKNFQVFKEKAANLAEEKEKYAEESSKSIELAAKLKKEIDRKCQDIFAVQQENKELVKINSEQSEIIINLNLELNSFKRHLKSSSRNISLKSNESTLTKIQVERLRPESNSKELSRTNSLFRQPNKIRYASIDDPKEKIESLERELASTKKVISTLKSENEVLMSTQKKITSRLKAEYEAFSAFLSLTPKPFDCLENLISEIFEIFPSRYQEEISRLDDIIKEMTEQLNSRDNYDREILSQSRSNQDYLIKEIDYLKEECRSYENQKKGCLKVLADALGEECLSEYKGILLLVDRLNELAKENKSLTGIVDFERIKGIGVEREFDRGKGDGRNRGIDEFGNNFGIGGLSSDVKNLQILLREYRKHKQEQEKKIEVLQKNLLEACRMRDVLENELAMKCDIIEKLSKPSLYRKQN